MFTRSRRPRGFACTLETNKRSLLDLDAPRRALVIEITRAHLNANPPRRERHFRGSATNVRNKYPDCLVRVYATGVPGFTTLTGHHDTYGPGGVGLGWNVGVHTPRFLLFGSTSGTPRATRGNVMDGVGHFFERRRDNSYQNVNVMLFAFRRMR